MIKTDQDNCLVSDLWAVAHFVKNVIKMAIKSVDNMWFLKCHHVKIYHQTYVLTTSHNPIREIFPFSSFRCEFGTAVLQGEANNVMPPWTGTVALWLENSLEEKGLGIWWSLTQPCKARQPWLPRHLVTQTQTDWITAAWSLSERDPDCFACSGRYKMDPTWDQLNCLHLGSCGANSMVELVVVV